MFARGEKGPAGGGRPNASSCASFFQDRRIAIEHGAPGREALRGQLPWRKVVEAGKGET
jgi:hypothetical protein